MAFSALALEIKLGGVDSVGVRPAPPGLDEHPPRAHADLQDGPGGRGQGPIACSSGTTSAIPLSATPVRRLSISGREPGLTP